MFLRIRIITHRSVKLTRVDYYLLNPIFIAKGKN